ncbi:MAG: hypothetical protein ACUVQ5_05945 [Candidatus Methanomethylicaceae archaeon]
MEEISNSIKKYVDEGRGFELKFEGDKAVLSELKGISKLVIGKGEMRGLPLRKGGKKILEEQKVIILGASKTLVSNRIPLKVTVGSKETTIRFDLDHYIHMYPDKCVVVGFKSLDEPPLSIIKEYFSKYQNLKFLTPKR